MVRATVKPTAQVNTWEKDLADQAAASMEQEKNAAGTGQFFGLRSGILTFEGQTIPGNRMAVIILDGIMENVFYEGAFNADNPTNPSCFAFGRSEKEMAPNPDDVAEPVHTECGKAGQPGCCPMNEWKTAVKQDGTQGKGKACRNTRRLAMIPAGNFLGDVFQPIKDIGHFEEAKTAYMKLPVTSVKGYAGYVTDTGKAHNRPPHGVITQVKVVPDADNQFRVEFEAICKVPNELMEVVMARHHKAKEEIAFPYQPPTVAPEPEPTAAPARGKAAPPPPARGKVPPPAPARRSKF